jgi:hypothetical protein
MAAAADKVGWPKEKGEVCLYICTTPDCTGEYDPTGTVSLYAQRMGKGHYLVVGRNVEASGDIVPFSGSAEIVQLPEGPVVRMQVALTFSNPGFLYGQMAMVTGDPTTLAGTVEGLNLRVNKSDNDSAANYFSFYTRSCQ